MTLLHNDKIARWFYILLFFFAIIVPWEFCVSFFKIQPVVLPPPSGVAIALINLVKSPYFWENYIFTLHEVFLGYGLAILIALILAIIISQFRPLRLGFLPYVVAFQAIPTIAIAPIIQHWIGYEMTSKVVMTAFIAFFPMLINFIAGLQAARHDEIQMLKSFGATRFQVLMKVRIPYACPFVFAGLDLGIIFAITGATVAEFVGSDKGVIRLFLYFNSQVMMAEMFAVLITLSVTSMTLHGLIGYIKKRVVFWEGE